MKKDFKELFSKAKLDVNRELRKNELRKSTVYADSLNQKLYESVSESFRHDGNEEYGNITVESYTTDEMPVLFTDVKREIRRIFCKYGVVNEDIGCHPDFLHLKDSQELENGYAVTMFFDIAGSTKLGKTYQPDMVFNIKNTVIRYVIEIIQAFDGHVHRIMGDAVMAFFRSKDKVLENREIDSAIDALNAGVYILEFMEQVVRPELGDAGAEKPIGVRIGIDYAKDRDIIWGNYGASGAFEVTATSYNVDVAAKLQQAADTDSIMVGNNLKELLGLGREYLSVLSRIKKDNEGKTFTRYYPHVSPNYSVRGSKIDYKQYVLDNSNYFKFLPYGLDNTNISVSLTASQNGVDKVYHCPCSEGLKKGMSLIFHITFNAPSDQKFTVKSVKQNTGPDAEAHTATSPQTRFKAMNYYNGAWHAEISESTSYHGLHHMKVIILNNSDEEIDETTFSIYIQ